MFTYMISRAVYTLFLVSVALTDGLENITSAQDAEPTTVTKTVQFTIFEVQSPATTPTSTWVTSKPVVVLQPLHISVPALLAAMTGIDCDVTLPGMVMQPCVVKPTKSSTEIGSLVTMTQLAFNASTITQTVTSTLVAGTETKTITQILTLDVGASSLATGFCFWDEQQILMPCTNMVAATAKPSKSAAFRARNNPFQRAIRYIKDNFSNGTFHTADGLTNSGKHASNNSILWSYGYA